MWKVRPREVKHLTQGHSWWRLPPEFELGPSDSRAILLSLYLWMQGISLVKHAYRHAWCLHARVLSHSCSLAAVSFLAFLGSPPGDCEQIWGSLAIRLICSTDTYSAPTSTRHYSKMLGIQNRWNDWDYFLVEPSRIGPLILMTLMDRWREEIGLA